MANGVVSAVLYYKVLYQKIIKAIVTVFSSVCLLIGFGVPIIDYICNYLIWPPYTSYSNLKKINR